MSFATDDNEDERCASCRADDTTELPLKVEGHHCDTFKARQALKNRLNRKENDLQDKGN
jgi:hypothetical protein